MPGWLWVSASKKGTSHERSGTRLQDACSTFRLNLTDKDIFIAIVADGAGSAEYGGEGASLVCRSVGQAVRKHFMNTAIFPDKAQVASWLTNAKVKITESASKREIENREFASTFLLAISTGNETLTAHIGDGCIVLRNRSTSEWFAPIWPDHGDYASTTRFVTDEPMPEVRFEQMDYPIDTVALFTDGLERLALDFAGQLPYKPFFESVSRPLLNMNGEGRHRALSGSLGEFLDNPGINQRTDDDKTLVLAVYK